MMYKVENIKWDTDDLGREYDLNNLPIFSWIEVDNADDTLIEEKIAEDISFLFGIPVSDFVITAKS